MIIDYDHNQGLTIDQKLQSLKESVQMALDEVRAKEQEIANNVKLLSERIADIYSRLSTKEYDYTKFTYATGYTYYSTSDYNSPRAQKHGNIVQLTGAFTSLAAQSSAGNVYIGNVPEGCEPKQLTTAIAQGSGVNRFLLLIDPSGSISVDRYGSTSHIAIPSGAWLNIYCTYICE